MEKIVEMIATWVRNARKDAGLSQEALGAKLALELGEERGFTKANISHWETQKHSPNLRQLMAIAKITERTLPHEILSAVGATPATGESVERVSDARSTVPGLMPVRSGEAFGMVPIKRMNVSLSAGIMRLEPVYDESFAGEFDVPIELLSQLHLDPADLVAMKVKGQSMEPMMFEDDIVVVDVSDQKPINRELYAVLFDGEALIKQLLHRGGQWYMHSLNPDFGPVNIRSGEFKIIGRVVIQPARVVTGRL